MNKNRTIYLPLQRRPSLDQWEGFLLALHEGGLDAKHSMNALEAWLEASSAFNT